MFFLQYHLWKICILLQALSSKKTDIFQASHLIHLFLKTDFKSNQSEMCLVRLDARSLSVNIFHQFPAYRYVELCRNGFSYWEHILSGKSRKTGNRKETTKEKNLFFSSLTNATSLFWICDLIKRIPNMSFCDSSDLLKFQV